MTWNDLAPRRPLQMLQPLGTLEPCWMVSRQPTLGDSVTPILDDVAVVADEEESTAVWHIDLHADQAIGVPRQVMQGDALAEVKGSLIESLPVQAQLEIMLQVDANIGSSRDRPKRRSQFSVMDPDLDILPIQELV